jgi:hypothetical protein
MTSEDLRASVLPSLDAHDDSVANTAPDVLDCLHDSSPDSVPETVMSEVSETLGAEPAFDEDLVTHQLDELLLALVGLCDSETHGTGLMDSTEQAFGVQPSPGTVYPRLHEFEDEGVLMCHELVQTKQYSIADRDAAADYLRDAMIRHLAIGLFLDAALDAV